MTGFIYEGRNQEIQNQADRSLRKPTMILQTAFASKYLMELTLYCVARSVRQIIWSDSIVVSHAYNSVFTLFYVSRRIWLSSHLKMQKAKQYDWQDSNLALFGSDTEKEVKKAIFERHVHLVLCRKMNRIDLQTPFHCRMIQIVMLYSSAISTNDEWWWPFFIFVVHI